MTVTLLSSEESSYGDWNNQSGSKVKLWVNVWVNFWYRAKWHGRFLNPFLTHKETGDFCVWVLKDWGFFSISKVSIICFCCCLFVSSLMLIDILVYNYSWFSVGKNCIFFLDFFNIKCLLTSAIGSTSNFLLLCNKLHNLPAFINLQNISEISRMMKNKIREGFWKSGSGSRRKLGEFLQRSRNSGSSETVLLSWRSRKKSTRNLESSWSDASMQIDVCITRSSHRDQYF